MRRQRFDRSSPLESPETTQEGYLRLDGKIARTGIQIYRKADGTEVREYRPPSEVFSADYLRLLEGIPLTNTHPSALLSSQNASQHAVGAVTQARKLDDKWVGARMTLWDDAAKKSVQAGRAQLSVGYTAEVHDEAGETPEGEKYDAIQKNIVPNHLALCDSARAGEEARLRLDSNGDAVDDGRFRSSAEVALAWNERNESMAHKLRVDGQEFETSDNNAQIAVDKALSQARKDEGDKVRAEFEGKLKAQQDRADAAEMKSKALEEKSKSDAADQEKRRLDDAKQMASEMKIAEKYLGTKFESLGGPTEWKRAIAKLGLAKTDSEKERIDRMGPEGLQRVYEDAQAVLDMKQAELPKLGTHHDSSPEAARERMLERLKAQQAK